MFSTNKVSKALKGEYSIKNNSEDHHFYLNAFDWLTFFCQIIGNSANQMRLNKEFPLISAIMLDLAVLLKKVRK